MAHLRDLQYLTVGNWLSSSPCNIKKFKCVNTAPDAHEEFFLGVRREVNNGVFCGVVPAYGPVDALPRNPDFVMFSGSEKTANFLYIYILKYFWFELIVLHGRCHFKTN